ncbi:cytochrome-c peroxidase [Flavisericum labens]|uniref:cytochrome-c peroxidase n=1 Tax=Flavisericum labens TaxID=3377112 RepID=UPI00387B5DB8
MRHYKNIFLLVVLIGLFLNSCSKDIEYSNIESFDLKTNLAKKQANIALTPIQTLGKEIFFDKISSPGWMACSSCHAPSFGYSGPIAGININNAGVYRGADPHRFGNRKPPSAAYATFSPVFHYDEQEGLFIGGNFSDGRATGELLGNPAADQALGPFLNFVEQNNKEKEDVLKVIENSKYADLWTEVWGEPIDYSSDTKTEENYGRVGLSIAAFEASPEVNSFSSKYDLYLKGDAALTQKEEWGMQLFNDVEKGKCFLCHISETGPNGEPPLFTDFTFDNIGIPRNPDNPFYGMNEVYFENGKPVNPDGEDWIDSGLGGFLAKHENPAWVAMATENMGKHKVPTLRNIDKKPGNGSIKAYGHNGYFTSLKDIVHFYNTRDVENWPMPEVADNVNHDELGNLGLTDEEESAIVAFLGTLSDGYRVK